MKREHELRLAELNRTDATHFWVYNRLQKTTDTIPKAAISGFVPGEGVNYDIAPFALGADCPVGPSAAKAAVPVTADAPEKAAPVKRRRRSRKKKEEPTPEPVEPAISIAEDTEPESDSDE